MSNEVRREQDKIRELADEYRQRGYEVFVEPYPIQLPWFLAGYTPDLLVKKDDEYTVVEVKSRRTAGAVAHAEHIARIVEDQEGWNFELVVLDEPYTVAPPGAVEFDTDEARRGIEQAQHLLTMGQTAAALLLGWAAFEATLRLILESEGMVLRFATPSNLMKLAVGNGILTRDEYQSLSDIMYRRNALAHGYSEPSFDADRVEELVTVTKRLLTEMSPTSA